MSELNFLCCGHRTWLHQADTDAVMNFWQDLIDYAFEPYQQRDWKSCLPLLGASFEVSEILLCTTYMKDIDRFVASAYAFMNVLVHLGEYIQALHIKTLTEQRLKRFYEACCYQQTRAYAKTLMGLLLDKRVYELIVKRQLGFELMDIDKIPHIKLASKARILYY